MEAMDLVSWNILLRFFQLEIADDICGELSISILLQNLIKPINIWSEMYYLWITTQLSCVWMGVGLIT